MSSMGLVHDVFYWAGTCMRLFQVQPVHFGEIKEHIDGPMFCKIEALYLKTEVDA